MTINDVSDRGAMQFPDPKNHKQREFIMTKQQSAK